jgi:hypothetical protein
MRPAKIKARLREGRIDLLVDMSEDISHEFVIVQARVRQPIEALQMWLILP